MNEHYPFPLKPLPYSYDALEPVIDSNTLHFHHDKHLATYVDNLNKALADHAELHSLTLTQLILEAPNLPCPLSTAITNNAGGVFNHQMYFDTMGQGDFEGTKVKNAILQSFGSMEKWKEQMKTSALSVFGSGWAWLVANKNKELNIVTTPNQENPISCDLFPILSVDVWEHAYYLQYQNLRANYVDLWFSIINWDQVDKNYLALS